MATHQLNPLEAERIDLSYRTGTKLEPAALLAALEKERLKGNTWE